MDRVINFSLGDNFIDKIANFIFTNFYNSKNDFSKIACVFGGNRPALFLKRALFKKINKPFYPPVFFTIEEFMEYIVGSGEKIKKIKELDANYLIYKIVKLYLPSILKGKNNFVDFLPLAKEIYSFVEQIDLENIDNRRLLSIEKSAEIGYDVPKDINILLKNIVKIRNLYHNFLLEKNTYSRGLLFLEASKIVENKNFDNFEIILFCNFFYLHNTEKKVFKEIYKKGKAIFIFQGSSKEWTVLDKNFKDLGITNHFIEEKRNQCNFFLYQGFDIQSQCVIVRHILQNISNIENTVIVLPQPQTLIPLLTEISSIVKEFNVSLGYPLERSSIYSLLRNIAKTQETKKENKYYTKDYINLLKHPLVENLKLVNNLETTRVIIHKLEELLQGKLEKNYISSITGKLFLDLEEVENEKIIYELSKTTLVNMGISAEIDDCKTVILKLHYLFFKIWENSNTFKKFAENLEIILNLLIEKSTVFSFPFNLKILEKFYEITKEFATLSFKDELFPLYDIWKIFMKKIENEVISFVGSPLKNLQILGLFETRSLTFENVIIIDVNETVFPKLRLYEPFIPREVMINLGLNRLEKEEEIQRYHFKSLISGAKNIYLVYEKTEEKEKSRFIEELLWNLQKEKKSLDVIEIPKIFFPMEIILKKHCVEKTTLVLEFLKNQIYSANRLNTYLDCPMKFYYEYVLGLEKEEELLNEPQSEHIGNFIHSLLEETFSNFKNRKPIIDQKFKKYFFKVMEERFKNNLLPRMKADYYLLKKILQYRLENFLKLEAKRNTRRILCLEEEKNDIIILNNEKINFVYRVDRIDELEDGKILIIDYKTGTKDIVPNRLGSLEKMEMNIASIRENIKSFQLPLYYYFISQRLSQKEINVEVCNLRTLEKKYFISEKDWEKKEKILEICMEALKVVLEEIFNPNIPFLAVKEERKCKNCLFNLTCK